MLLPSIVDDQMEEKLSQRLTAAILKDFRSENIECSKYQLIFMTAEEVSSKLFLSRLRNKTASLFQRIYVCLFLLEESASLVFYSTHFSWLSAHSGNAVTRNQSGGVLLFNSPFGHRRLLALPPPPTPTVHPYSKSNMPGWINDRELTTLARTNKTPALQASLRQFYKQLVLKLYIRVT